MELLITIDVEGGSGVDQYDCVERTASLLEKLDVLATLFVTPDVVQARTDVVRSWLRSDHLVGIHVHPARLSTGHTTESDPRADFLTTYDRPEIDALVSEALDVFETELGVRPRSFRAGRWEFSDRLLAVLGDRGFTHDASLRPREYQTPYDRYSITEVPMTVYDAPFVRPLLRPFDIDSVPLHTDAFLDRRATVLPFYAATYLVSRRSSPYLMVSLHDYDLERNAVSNRIVSYLQWIKSRSTVAPPTTVDSVDPHPEQ